MASPREFARRMFRRARNVEENFDDYLKTLATEVDQRVVTETPILSGRAKINWLVQAGPRPTKILKAPANPSDAIPMALKHAQEEIAKFDSTKHRVIHITNNLPYINRLNDTPQHSKQAPPGYLEDAIREAGKRNANPRFLATAKVGKKRKGGPGPSS